MGRGGEGGMGIEIRWDGMGRMMADDLAGGEMAAAAGDVAVEWSLPNGREFVYRTTYSGH